MSKRRISIQELKGMSPFALIGVLGRPDVLKELRVYDEKGTEFEVTSFEANLSEDRSNVQVCLLEIPRGQRIAMFFSTGGQNDGQDKD